MFYQVDWDLGSEDCNVDESSDGGPTKSWCLEDEATDIRLRRTHAIACFWVRCGAYLSHLIFVEMLKMAPTLALEFYYNLCPAQRFFALPQFNSASSKPDVTFSM